MGSDRIRDDAEYCPRGGVFLVAVDAAQDSQRCKEAKDEECGMND